MERTGGLVRYLLGDRRTEVLADVLPPVPLGVSRRFPCAGEPLGPRLGRQRSGVGERLL